MMKKIAFVVVFLLVSKLTFAQEVRFGVRLSPILAFSSISDKDKNAVSGLTKSSRVGFAGGLMATYQFAEKFGIHSGLNIVLKGFEYEGAFPAGSTRQTTKVNLTTVEIPLALHMRTNEISNGLRIRGLFGGSFNILASSKTDITSAGATPFSTKKSDGIYKLVPDFLFGAGVEWSLRDAGMIDLGFRFNLPLFLATDRISTVSNNTISNTEGRIKVSYLSLDLGYYF
ncbi:porin family protein [Thermoflexibacter ruber]|uniref:Outer membrane protein beta-barrel domain-containing protein n=1 Tax=Thermoflexibacter ruber TaxID=1003 RepID=A0A1I2IYT0_9BACT|nr:porin family protein [Thermoflexibacter ruber]SFF46878.1 Outer membrane protein beta-barrel domain-containing protein [Thermoflexibacter ruber]